MPPVSPTAQTMALVTQLMLVIKLMVGINLVLIHSTLLARAAWGQQITTTLLLTRTTGPLRRIMARTLTACVRAPVHCIRRTGTIAATALSSGAWKVLPCIFVVLHCIVLCHAMQIILVIYGPPRILAATQRRGLPLLRLKRYAGYTAPELKSR